MKGIAREASKVGAVAITIGDRGFAPSETWSALAQAVIIERNYNVHTAAEWRTAPITAQNFLTAIAPAKPIDVTYSFRFPEAFSSLVDMTPRGLEGLAFVSIANGQLSIAVVAASVAEVTRILGYFTGSFPREIIIHTPTSPKIYVNFWMMTSTGPRAITKSLDVTKWRDVAGNYAGGTREALDSLMVGFKPERSGALLLWHGVPGTGKTWAIRALGWEWQSWCTVHYVMDPVELLNGGPGYLQELLFADSGPEARYIVEEEDDVEKLPVGLTGRPSSPQLPPPQTNLFGSGGKWRLIVMEDTGELLTADAAARTGQALSRLLNSADGLLGQGSRVMFIITTNEEMGKIHPAVSRPGRAAANVFFDSFSEKESVEWLKSRGITHTVKDPMTLAELYAVSSTGKQVVALRERKGFGFAKEKR